MELRPIDIARKLDVGTSALRHYEEWGIVPPAKRKKNGYRMYTEIHEAYFQCIRAMYPGYGMALIKKIMPMIQQKKFTEALWEVNQIQAALYQKRQQAIQALETLKSDHMEKFMEKRKKKWYMIGETAKVLDVPASTLRHWEKERLIQPRRDPDNGYRIYDKEDIRQLVMIRTLQSSVYFLDSVRSIIKEINQRSISEVRKIVLDSLKHMDIQIEQQLRGGYYLYRLIELLKSKEKNLSDYQVSSASS